MTHINSLSPSQSRHQNINIISNCSDNGSSESLTRKNSLVSPLDWDNQNTEFQMDVYKLHQQSHSSSSVSFNRNKSGSSEIDSKKINKAVIMDETFDQKNFDDDDDDDDDSFDFSDEDNDDDELNHSKRKKLDGSSKKKGSNTSSKEVNMGVMDSKAKEKNRYHAKNTRMRKKNYIDSMRDQVISLSGAYEDSLIERKRITSALAEKFASQKNCLMTFFRLRASGERNQHMWNDILDSNAVITLPITPYRSFPPHQVINNQRYILGVDAVIADTMSLFVMIQSLGDQREIRNGHIQAEYTLDFNDVVMDGATLMCKWSLRTINAISKGARYEVFKHGMLQVLYAPNTNKILSMNMSHDVMSFMQELRRCSGSYDFQLIPNTYNIACEDSPEMRLIVDFNGDNLLQGKIVFVNNALSDIFGTVPLKGQNFEEICHRDKQNLQVISSCIQSAVSQCAVVETISLRNDEGTNIALLAKFFPLYKINQSKSATDNCTQVSHVLIVMDPLSLKGSTKGMGMAVSKLVTEEGQSTNSNMTDTSGTSSLVDKNRVEKNDNRNSRYKTVSQVTG